MSLPLISFLFYYILGRYFCNGTKPFTVDRIMCVHSPHIFSAFGTNRFRSCSSLSLPSLCVSHLLNLSSVLKWSATYSIFRKRIKYPQRNNLCNLLFFGTSIGYSDIENQGLQSEICRGCSVASPNGRILRDILLDIPSQSLPKFSALQPFLPIGSEPSQDRGK